LTPVRAALAPLVRDFTSPGGGRHDSLLDEAFALCSEMIRLSRYRRHLENHHQAVHKAHEVPA